MIFINRFQKLNYGSSAILAAVFLFGIGTPAHAGLIIDATFGSSITSQTDAAGIEAALNAAVSALEGDISTNVTAYIDFEAVNTGLGGSSTYIYTRTYYDYYNALKAIATAPGASAAQKSAFASLGTAPTNESSVNPVTGSTIVDLTGPEMRMLGFSVSEPGAGYDTQISLNTNITDPPQPNNGSNYGLQAVATHELDEALGIGGTGSTIDDCSFDPESSCDVGTMDLFRYTCSITITASLTCPAGDVSRSYSNVQTTSPYSYFSDNGGLTVLSFFNQTAGGDYGDWLSNPIPTALGFGTQVQDAYGTPGTNPSLGVSELTALNVIGYNLAAPEPGTMALFGLGFAGLAFLQRRRRA